MPILRTGTWIFFGVITAYSLLVVSTQGMGFVRPFLDGVLSGTWQGQFNVDFAGYLMLSGLWIAWRSGFSTAGIAVGLVASMAGMMVFAPYLLWQIRQAEGSFARLLLGVHSHKATEPSLGQSPST